MERKGFDISSYQEGIDFNIFNIDTDFLILRAGFTGWGTGVNYNKDKCFEDFYKKCKENNIPVGCYYYSCANNYDKGVQEALFLYENCLKGKQFDYPVFIDVENEQWQLNNKEGVTNACIGFCRTLEEKGFYVGIYGSDIATFQEKVHIQRLTDFDFWVARYGKKPQYVKEVSMWQEAEDYLHYGNKLDRDICYIDYPSIIKNKGFNGYSVNDNIQLLQVVKDVFLGKYGNGQERKNRLGSSYSKVQYQVNKNIANNKDKTIEEIIPIVKIYE